MRFKLILALTAIVILAGCTDSFSSCYQTCMNLKGVEVEQYCDETSWTIFNRCLTIREYTPESKEYCFNQCKPQDPTESLKKDLEQEQKCIDEFYKSHPARVEDIRKPQEGCNPPCAEDERCTSCFGPGMSCLPENMVC